MKDFRDPHDRTTGNAKLNEETVRELRRRYRAGTITVRGIGNAYNMSSESIRRMLRGETWAWVQDAPQVSEEQLAARIQSSQEKLMAMLKKEGLMQQAGLEAQEELGVNVPDSIKRQSEMLTGRKFGTSDDVLGGDGEPSSAVGV